MRIFAYHDVENSEPGRGMEKSGMKKEEIILGAKRRKGEFVSIVLRGITKKNGKSNSKK